MGTNKRKRHNHNNNHKDKNHQKNENETNRSEHVCVRFFFFFFFAFASQLWRYAIIDVKRRTVCCVAPVVGSMCVCVRGCAWALWAQHFFFVCNLMPLWTHFLRLYSHLFASSKHKNKWRTSSFRNASNSNVISFFHFPFRFSTSLSFLNRLYCDGRISQAYADAWRYPKRTKILHIFPLSSLLFLAIHINGWIELDAMQNAYYFVSIRVFTFGAEQRSPLFRSKWKLRFFRISKLIA